MKEEIREGDVVEVTLPTGNKGTARVRWVNEEGQAGITYIAPDSHKGGATVIGINELEVIQRDMGEVLKYASVDELKDAITRLRGMRMPKKLATRGTSTRTRKLSQKSVLETLMEKAGGELDGLIARAIKEIKDEKGGDKEDGN